MGLGSSIGREVHGPSPTSSSTIRPKAEPDWETKVSSLDQIGRQRSLPVTQKCQNIFNIVEQNIETFRTVGNRKNRRLSGWLLLGTVWHLGSPFIIFLISSVTAWSIRNYNIRFGTSGSETFLFAALSAWPPWVEVMDAQAFGWRRDDIRD